MKAQWRRFRRRYIVFGRRLHIFNDGPEFDTSVAICGVSINGKERKVKSSDTICLDCHEILQRGRERTATALNQISADHERLIAYHQRRLDDLNTEADCVNRILRGAQ